MMTNRLLGESALYPDGAQYPYADAFMISPHGADTEAWALIPVFFQSVPGWIGSLFVLRNQIVRHFGLQTVGMNRHILDPPFQMGRKIGLFRLLALTDYEVAISEDDCQLDFRISLLLICGDIGSQSVASTLAKTMNSLGEAYFSAVKPDYRFIVPVVLKAMATPLNLSDSC